MSMNEFDQTNQSKIILYQSDDGLVSVDVIFQDETFWLTQAAMVELFQSSKSNISEHLKHIFEEFELDEFSVVRDFRTTAADDSQKPNMGLTSWKNAPYGKILQADVTKSKNYLHQNEISELNDIANMYLDYAENQAKRHKLMSMQDWANRLDAFLQFNEYDLLHNKGTVERKVADTLAKAQYKEYRVIQDKNFVSDFDRSTQKYLAGNNGKEAPHA